MSVDYHQGDRAEVLKRALLHQKLELARELVSSPRSRDDSQNALRQVTSRIIHDCLGRLTGQDGFLPGPGAEASPGIAVAQNLT
eukprot:gene9084-biopygen8972